MKTLTRTLISTCLTALLLSAAAYAAEISIELEAELKVPNVVTISENHLEEAKKAKLAAAELAKLHKEMGTLSRDYKGKEQLISELSKKIQERQVVVMNARNSAHGVHMELILKNPGKTDVTLNLGGDASLLTIQLTGPDAVNLPYSGPMTADLKRGTPVTIKAGGTYTMPIQELRHGNRDKSRWLVGSIGEYRAEVSLSVSSGRSFVPILKARPVSFKVVPDESIDRPVAR